jgi:hypothetical protein
LCGQVARRDDARLARRLYRKQVVDGVYRLDEGAWLDDFFQFLQAVGVMALLEQVHGRAIYRAMVPVVQYGLLYGVKTLVGMESMHALAGLLCSDEALMRLVGFKVQQVSQGMCQRGASQQQGERSPGLMCPDTVAKHIVKWDLRDLEAVFNGSIRAVAKVGVFGATVTGIADGTDLATTAGSIGCGQVTRKVRIEDKRGREHKIEVTIYGWKVLWLIDAATKIHLAVKVGKIDDHATHWTRALVAQARTNLAGVARLHTVLFAKGFLAGSDLWWLEQHGIIFVVPAQTTMAVVVDARAQASAGEDITVGRRVHTVRHGQGRTAGPERLETEVVGISALTTSDQYGPPEHVRHANRRDFQANLLNAVVGRKWQGKAYGPGGKTVFLTHAAEDTPLQPFDDDDDRSLIEHCCSKACQQP